MKIKKFAAPIALCCAAVMLTACGANNNNGSTNGTTNGTTQNGVMGDSGNNDPQNGDGNAIGENGARTHPEEVL